MATKLWRAGGRGNASAWMIGVACVGLTASFSLWNPLEIYEREHVCRTTEQSMQSLRADIASDMQMRLLAQVRLAELCADRGSFTAREVELSSRLFLDHHDGYLALEWVDAGYRVVWSLSRMTGGEAVTGAERGSLAEWLAHSPPSAGKPTVMPRFELPNGRPAFRVVVPVVRADAIAGYLVAMVDLQAAFDSMVDDHKELGYSVSVLEGGTEIYNMPGSTREYEASLSEQGTLHLPGVAWTVRVWPNREALSRWRSSLPEVALVLGGLLGCLVVVAVHFGRAAQRGSWEVQRAHDKLEQRVKERTLELEAVNGVLQKEVAERRRAEDSYRDLSGRLLRLQDEERRRIARELHDSTAQMLGALAINVDRSLALMQAGNLEGVQRVLGESGQFVENVTQEIRTVSYLLHPPMLDDLGLQYVLPWYANGFSERSGISTHLEIQPDLGRLPREVELTLFRLVQESLANVHRHSGSPSVSIRLCRESATATLEVRDQGTGLPYAVLESGEAAAAMGVGIAGMRERVRQLRGRMEITSSRDGTTLRTVLPLADAAVSANAA